MPAWAGSGGEERLAPHPKIGRSWVRISLLMGPFTAVRFFAQLGVRVRVTCWVRCKTVWGSKPYFMGVVE